MRGAIPPLSQYVFMAWCLVHRANFTFTLPLSSVLRIFQKAFITSRGHRWEDNTKMDLKYSVRV